MFYQHIFDRLTRNPWFKYFDWLLVYSVLLCFAGAECLLEKNIEQTIYSFAFCTAVSAPLLFLPKTLNRIYTILIIPLVLAGIFLHCFIRYFYQIPVNETLISIIFSTSLSESRDFFCKTVLGGPLSTALLLLLFAGLVILEILSWKLKNTPSRRMRYTGLFLLLPVVLVISFCSVTGDKEKLSNLFIGVKFYHANQRYQEDLKKYVDILQNPKFPNGLKRENNDNLLGVIILGESATRHHHSVYGYNRDTTPNMSKLYNNGELFIFDSVVSSKLQTAPAYTQLFTFETLESPAPQCTLDACARKVGFRTIVIDTLWGWNSDAYETPMKLMFKGATKTIYLSELYNRRFMDEDLLPVIAKELENKSNHVPTLLFIHLIGSHDPFYLRSPERFKKYPPRDAIPGSSVPEIRKLIGEYDNSILYSDYIINEIISLIKNTDRESFVLYFSDHGEAVYPGMTKFKMRDPDCKASYEIPLFLWLSPQYKEKRPEFETILRKNQSKKHQTDRLIYGILNLLEISYDDFPVKDDLFSQEYRPRTRYSHKSAKKIYFDDKIITE